VIRLGRSSTIFVRQHLASALCSDPLLVAKYHPPQLQAVHGLESRFPQLAWLRSFIERQCGDQEGAVCLTAAAESLFVSIARLADIPDIPTQVRTIWEWASNVDDSFLDMCSARDPVALVIFAHFAVLMSLGRDTWYYFQSWPAVLLGQIRELLGDELKDTIRWPEDIIFRGGLVLPPGS
jgi:hypothetical protein